VDLLEAPLFVTNRKSTILAIALGTAGFVFPAIAGIPTVSMPGDGSHTSLDAFRDDPALACVVVVVAAMAGAALAMIAFARPLKLPPFAVPGCVIAVIGAIVCFAGAIALSANPLFGFLIGGCAGTVVGSMYACFTLLPLGVASIAEARPTFSSSDVKSLGSGLWLLLVDGWLVRNIETLPLRTRCGERCLDANGGHAPVDVVPLLTYGLTFLGLGFGLYLVARAARGMVRRERLLRRVHRGEVADLRVRALDASERSSADETLPLRLVDTLKANSVIERVTLAPIAAGYRSAPTEIVESVALVYTA